MNEWTEGMFVNCKLGKLYISNFIWFLDSFSVTLLQRQYDPLNKTMAYENIYKHFVKCNICKKLQMSSGVV